MSLRQLALAAMLVALFGAGVWQIVDLVRPAPVEAAGTGTLTVGDTTYAFTPTTCFISEEDFVAAGNGYDGSEQFWVSASSTNLDLTVGTQSELERPPADKLWLENDRSISWVTVGNSALTAVTQMSDHRQVGSAPVTGRLELRCDV